MNKIGNSTKTPQNLNANLNKLDSFMKWYDEFKYDYESNSIALTTKREDILISKLRMAIQEGGDLDWAGLGLPNGFKIPFELLGENAKVYLGSNRFSDAYIQNLSALKKDGQEIIMSGENTELANSPKQRMELLEVYRQEDSGDFFHELMTDTKKVFLFFKDYLSYIDECQKNSLSWDMVKDYIVPDSEIMPFILKYVIGEKLNIKFHQFSSTTSMREELKNFSDGLYLISFKGNRHIFPISINKYNVEHPSLLIMEPSRGSELNTFLYNTIDDDTFKSKSILTLSIQKSFCDCAFFSLAIAKCLSKSPTLRDKLHTEETMKLIDSGRNEDEDLVFKLFSESKIFKFAQDRKVINNFLKLYPEKIAEVLSKKSGETLKEYTMARRAKRVLICGAEKEVGIVLEEYRKKNIKTVVDYLSKELGGLAY